MNTLTFTPWKRTVFMFLTVCWFVCPTSAQSSNDTTTYHRHVENHSAQLDFQRKRFGIFLHWGIYSLFAQGEWYLNRDINEEEYAKAAHAFYPHRFNAEEWVKAIKGSGAQYICFTSRHHDGFSMYKTAESNYNIVEGTPFKRDVMKELAEACQKENVGFHVYYSLLDWRRTDYPLGRTGRHTGREMRPDYDSYFAFMKRQMKEIITGYPNVGAIWLDGYWDHDEDSVPFNWRMKEFYRYIHELKPACLIGNNHHIAPIEGEDFQMFERDLPGENKAGLSGQDISRLPLEMCQTMNGMWGYKVADTDYKPVDSLVVLLVRAAAKGSNLLLNIGPQPDGTLPAQALERLKGIGNWMHAYGPTIYNTTTDKRGEYSWGVITRNDNTRFLHVLQHGVKSIVLDAERKPRKIVDFVSRLPLPYVYSKRQKKLTITITQRQSGPDHVIEVLD